MIKLTAIIFSFFLLFVSPVTVKAYTNVTLDSLIPSARLVIPGKSIGLSAINEKDVQVYKQLKAASTEDASMGGKVVATWYSKPIIHSGDTLINSTSIYFTTNMGQKNQATRVDHIRVTSPYFVTKQGLGSGSTLRNILKQFPKLKKAGSYTSPTAKQEVNIYDDSAGGIAFEIDTQQKCIAITVHRPGKISFEIYNTLFDVNYL